MCVCVCVPIRMLKINSNHAEISGCLEFSGLRSSTIALQSPSLQLAGRWAWRLQLAHLQLEEGHIQRFRKTGPVGPCTIHFSYLFLLIRMYLPNCRVFFWVSFLMDLFFEVIAIPIPFIFRIPSSFERPTTLLSLCFFPTPSGCDLEMFLVLNHIPITWPIQFLPFQWLTVCQYWSSDVGQTEFSRY